MVKFGFVAMSMRKNARLDIFGSKVLVPFSSSRDGTIGVCYVYESIAALEECEGKGAGYEIVKYEEAERSGDE